MTVVEGNAPGSRKKKQTNKENKRTDIKTHKDRIILNCSDRSLVSYRPVSVLSQIYRL